MKFYKNLYLSESAEKKQNKIISKLKKNKIQTGVFLITISTNEAEQLDIIQSLYLLQPEYPVDDLLVVGIAKSQDEAIELVEQIANEVFVQTGDLDIRNYIIGKEQES